MRLGNRRRLTSSNVQRSSSSSKDSVPSSSIHPWRAVGACALCVVFVCLNAVRNDVNFLPYEYVTKFVGVGGEIGRETTSSTSRSITEVTQTPAAAVATETAAVAVRTAAIIAASTPTTPVVNEEECRKSIEDVIAPLLPRKVLPTMLSIERKRNVVETMIKAVLQRNLMGDWVETGTWRGGASLLAAIVQRTAIETPACGTPVTRSIWLADSFEGLPPDASSENKQDGYTKDMDPPGSYGGYGGVETVKQLFVDHGFAVDGSGPVPIHFLKGWFDQTLPDSSIGDIAVLRLDGDMYSSTLHALFALYRRVRIGGYIIVDDYGHWPQCAKAIDEFFVDANVTLERIDYTGRWFQKTNTDVRVPPEFNSKYVSIHPKVLTAWNTLDQWHKESKKQFFGHVGNNRFQTQRYTETIRHIIQQKKRQSLKRVNICETGFNGGHSAMLFMAFQDDEPDVDVYYYGWDLKEVGSSLPVATKMEQIYGDKFTITWGDSKETLQQLAATLKDQRCDMIIVDGEHSKIGVRSDLKYLLEFATPGATVFGDDCAPYKRTVPRAPDMKEAWMEYVESKQLISVANYRNPQLGSPGFVEGVVPGPDGSFVLGPV